MGQVIWATTDPDVLGFIMFMLDEDDPRPAKEQLDANYQHGGGWRPFEGFTMNMIDMSIKYPGDPAYVVKAVAKLRDELITVYDNGWVAITQPDGSHEICRMD